MILFEKSNNLAQLTFMLLYFSCIFLSDSSSSFSSDSYLSLTRLQTQWKDFKSFLCHALFRQVLKRLRFQLEVLKETVNVTGEETGGPYPLPLSPCSHLRHFAPGSPYPIPPTPCPISSTVGANSPRVYRIIKSVKTSFSQIAYLILFSAARSHSSLASEVSSSSLEITISIS